MDTNLSNCKEKILYLAEAEHKNRHGNMGIEKQLKQYAENDRFAYLVCVYLLADDGDIDIYYSAHDKVSNSELEIRVTNSNPHLKMITRMIIELLDSLLLSNNRGAGDEIKWQIHS